MAGKSPQRECEAAGHRVVSAAEQYMLLFSLLFICSQPPAHEKDPLLVRAGLPTSGTPLKTPCPRQF